MNPRISRTEMKVIAVALGGIIVQAGLVSFIARSQFAAGQAAGAASAQTPGKKATAPEPPASTVTFPPLMRMTEWKVTVAGNLVWLEEALNSLSARGHDILTVLPLSETKPVYLIVSRGPITAPPPAPPAKRPKAKRKPEAKG